MAPRGAVGERVARGEGACRKVARRSKKRIMRPARRLMSATRPAHAWNAAASEEHSLARIATEVPRSSALRTACRSLSRKTPAAPRTRPARPLRPLGQAPARRGQRLPPAERRTLRARQRDERGARGLPARRTRGPDSAPEPLERRGEGGAALPVGHPHACCQRARAEARGVALPGFPAVEAGARVTPRRRKRVCSSSGSGPGAWGRGAAAAAQAGGACTNRISV